MKSEEKELRMPADEFDRIMRGALQVSAPSVKQPKAGKADKKAKASVKRRKK